MIATVGHSLDKEQLGRLLADAWDVADSLPEHVSAETREAAFRMAFEAMLRNGRNGTAVAEPEEQASSPTLSEGDPIDDLFATEVQRTDAVASYLGISLDEARDLYNLEGPEPHLIVRRNQLSQDSATDAMRQITLLVCAGRAAINLDTGTSHVRRAVSDILGSDANLLRTIEGMSEVSLRGASGSRNRLVRMKGLGVDAVREFAKEIVAA